MEAGVYGRRLTARGFLLLTAVAALGAAPLSGCGGGGNGDDGNIAQTGTTRTTYTNNTGLDVYMWDASAGESRANGATLVAAHTSKTVTNTFPHILYAGTGSVNVTKQYETVTLDASGKPLVQGKVTVNDVPLEINKTEGMATTLNFDDSTNVYNFACTADHSPQ